MAAKENHDAATQSEGKPFRLSDLPPELQSKIFEHYAVEPKSGIGPSLLPWARIPPLAHVCRSIRHDVLKAYHTQNTFAIHACGYGDGIGAGTIEWTESVDPEHLKHVRTLLFSSCHGEYLDTLVVEESSFTDACAWCLERWLWTKGVELVPAGKDILRRVR